MNYFSKEFLMSKIPTRKTWIKLLKNEPKYLFYDVVGGFLYAFAISYFAQGANFATGGVTGIALIINHFTGSPLGLLTVLINVPIVMASFFFLGSIYLLRTTQTLLIQAVLMDLLLPLFGHYDGTGTRAILAVIFAGALSGIGLAMVYQQGSCTGGSDLIIMSMHKTHPHLSVGTITLLIDGTIVTCGAFAFGHIDAVLYGFLFTAISTYFMDRVMTGVLAGKVLLITSDKGEELARVLMARFERGGTLLHGEGAYTGSPKKILLMALSNKELPKVRRMAQEVDPKAFIIVLSYNEARGEGFLPMEEDGFA